MSGSFHLAWHLSWAKTLQCPDVTTLECFRVTRVLFFLLPFVPVGKKSKRDRRAESSAVVFKPTDGEKKKVSIFPGLRLWPTGGYGREGNISHKGKMRLWVEWRTLEVRNGTKGKRPPGAIIRPDGVNGSFYVILFEVDGLWHHSRLLHSEPSGGSVINDSCGWRSRNQYPFTFPPIFLSVNTRRSTGQAALPQNWRRPCFEMRSHQYGTLGVGSQAHHLNNTAPLIQCVLVAPALAKAR